MLVEQDERLEQLDQFFQAFEVSFGLHQRRFLQWQRRHDALNRLYDRLLRRSRHAVVASLGNRNRVKTQAQPGLQSLLRAIVLAVSERGQLDGAPHVAGVCHRGGELVERIVPAFHERGSNESHSAANEDNGNKKEALAFVRRQLERKSTRL